MMGVKFAHNRFKEKFNDCRNVSYSYYNENDSIQIKRKQMK